jgi:hypothetical protein
MGQVEAKSLRSRGSWSFIENMEPAMIDLVRELDDPMRRRDPELEVDIEIEDMLLDPWFLMSEEDIARLDDDPNASVLEIRLTPRVDAHDYVA